MNSLLVAAACVVVVVVVWALTPRLRRWPAALGLLIAVLTVVPPHQTLALGVGADDVLLLLGLALLLPTAFKAGWPSDIPYVRWLGVGAGLLIAGMTISAVVNGVGTAETVTLLARGAGRVLLYAAAVIVVLAQRPRWLTRSVVVRGLAVVGTLEAAVGLAAYVMGMLGLPSGFGLEEARGGTTLLGEIPGRASGTLGLSPNFLGALFVLAVPVTLGIALDAKGRRRWLWSAAALLQLVGLILTYTRSSLAVTVLACVVMFALRGRIGWLLGGVAAVGAALVAIPQAFGRIVSDPTDRLALYESAIKVFVDHPIAGVGPGQQAAFTAADPSTYRATSHGVAGNNAHNTVLLAAAENGVLGLLGALLLNIAFVVVAIAVIRRARRLTTGQMEPLAIGVAVLAFLAQGMANNLFTVTLTATALVLLVAGCALPWLDDGEDDRRVDDRPEAETTIRAL